MWQNAIGWRMGRSLTLNPSHQSALRPGRTISFSYSLGSAAPGFVVVNTRLVRIIPRLNSATRHYLGTELKRERSAY